MLVRRGDPIALLRFRWVQVNQLGAEWFYYKWLGLELGGIPRRRQRFRKQL